MAKFLFTVPPFAGHVNPTLGLGAALLRKGHEVAWCGFDPSLEGQLPEGGRFLMPDVAISEAETGEIKKEIEALGKKVVYGLDSLKFLYEDILLPMNFRMLDGIMKVAGSYKPGVIINDHQVFAGAVAAIRKNIPYATSVTAPAAIKRHDSLPMIHEWEGEKVIDFQEKAGIYGNARRDCSSLLTLVYTSKHFFGDAWLPDYYQFVGPVIDRKETDCPFDWDRFHATAGKPRLLLTTGTTFNLVQKQRFWGKVTEAFADKDIFVVIVSDPGSFEAVPDNFMVCKQVPQLRLLPEVDAVVCHGGHNTVCEALSFAKPLVVLPIAYDQSFVAGCVESSGAGIRLNFNRFTAGQLWDSVRGVLNDTVYAEKAATVRRSFLEAGGAGKAVGLLEKIIHQ